MACLTACLCKGEGICQRLATPQGAQGLGQTKEKGLLACVLLRDMLRGLALTLTLTLKSLRG